MEVSLQDGATHRDLGERPRVSHGGGGSKPVRGGQVLLPLPGQEPSKEICSKGSSSEWLSDCPVGLSSVGQGYPATRKLGQISIPLGE